MFKKLFMFLVLLTAFMCGALSSSIFHCWIAAKHFGDTIIEVTGSLSENDTAISERTEQSNEETTKETAIAEVPKTEEKSSEVRVRHFITVHPYESTRFSQAAILTREIADIREDDFGTAEKHIPIWCYKGGKRLNEDLVRRTIKAVVMRFPNLKHTKDLQDLLFETMLVESNLMSLPAEKLEGYNNIGIAQFRMDTASDTMKWLKKVRKDAYDVLMTLYKREMSLKDNLRYNIPFSIGLMAQYYWRVAPDIYPNITSLENRGILWKSVYNTRKGLGTVNAYVGRVNKYYGIMIADASK